MDLKALQSVLSQLETEKGISRSVIIEAIQEGLAHAYKKEYGKRDQIVRADFDLNSGDVVLSQVKIAVDESMIQAEDEEDEGGDAEQPNVEDAEEGEIKKIRFNSEKHIMIDEARMIKKDVEPGEELVFPLEAKEDYGRIAAQTAKQVVIQKIREAERSSVFGEFKNREGEIVSGIVQRIDNNNVFVDLGKTTAVLPKNEQVRGERYRVNERIKALLFNVEEGHRGINLHLSRTHPKFLIKLFEMEVPEIHGGAVEIKSIAREAGSRSKIAVMANEDIDPVGSCVGQKGIRVNTVISELGGEKVDIIEWSDDPAQFIANALSPAKILDVDINKENQTAVVTVEGDQLSLAIGKGGQNVRLANKLTGWGIDIKPRDVCPTEEDKEETDENIEEEITEEKIEDSE